LRVPAPGQAKKVAMMGAPAWVGRKLSVITSRTRRGFIAFLEELDRLHGPEPGLKTNPVVMVPDNGPIHVIKAAKTALAARAHWLTVEWLPKYTPELNDIEPVWRGLKGRNLARKTFSDAATPGRSHS
jgi:hypothetical protein